MASAKTVAFTALLLVLNMHWAQCQYLGYPGYCPQTCRRNDKNDLDAILPILILALLGKNDNGIGGGCGGGFGGGCGGGGCGCGCGCGCVCGCGCF